MKYNNKGFTLIEVLVGISLLLLIFSSIFGLVQLSFKIIAQAKARISATALANQKLELTRNLPYDQIGTLGGIPNGAIPETETLVINGITYTIKTTVVYQDDPFDNLTPTDPLPWDYKRIKVKISWPGIMGSSLSLMTDIAPKGIETLANGGIISILVFDASGQPIPQASIHIENSVSSPTINANYLTDNQGRLFLPGAPACNDCYKITASRVGFSSERTYAVGEIVRTETLTTPDKPFLSVINGNQSEISFTIDKLASKNIKTQTFAAENYFDDVFADTSKISDSLQIQIPAGKEEITLAQQAGQYYNSGYAISETITPAPLAKWNRAIVSFNIPASTAFTYQILDASSTNWLLISDDDLTINGIKNSEGFTISILDISGLNAAKYPSIKLKANFSTSDTLQTPSLYDWQIAWTEINSNSLGNLNFTMQGAKTLGNNISGEPINKYKENLSTDTNGLLNITNLEWDNFNITINPSTGFDLAESFPTQPVNINPSTSQNTNLKLATHQTNTLLVAVKNGSGQPISAARIRLFKAGYDNTNFSLSSGQTFFSPLANASYALEIKKTGYLDYSETFTITGQAEKVIILSIP